MFFRFPFTSDQFRSDFTFGGCYVVAIYSGDI